jgi:23S rRNA pseudouridine2605 synthase
METEKLQKILARLGLGSRREIEKWIDQGRVRINDQVAKLGDRASFCDKLFVDGQSITQKKMLKAQMLIYNKPEGEVCTRHDPEYRRTVFDSLPLLDEGRWVMIGRLDINTRGLLVFTNDGELANQWMHPSFEMEREYLVRLQGNLTEKIIAALLEGVQLEDGFAKFSAIEATGGEGINQWYKVILKEGRNREVRRLFESQGCMVNRLIRVRYGDIILPRDLSQGEWRYIN